MASPNPLPYPSDRQAIAASFRWPLGRLWLRVLARLMEWLTDVQPKQLNYSDVPRRPPRAGDVRPRQIKRLRQRCAPAVNPGRRAAQGETDAPNRARIEFLHVPTPDRY